MLLVVGLLLAAIVPTVGQPGASDPIERRIGAMSDEEKVGQLLFVGFDGTRNSAELRMLVSEWRVGGIAMYRQNVASTAQVRALTAAMRRLAGDGPEPFIALDQEGGAVRRVLEGVPELPSAMTLGATRSPDLAREAGRALGKGLRDLGFTMNFAPVLDVLSEPRNTALGNRAFSDDPHLVAELGTAFIKGHTEAGIAAVAKHFPGQGGTTGDSHRRLPVLNVSDKELDQRELIPFRRAIADGAPALMTAHIALPQIAESSGLPITVSENVLTHLLRRKLGFDGVLITDELQMESVRGVGSTAEAAVRAIRAGADMVLVVWDDRDRREIRRALLHAYTTGALPKARVHEALRRILWLKVRLQEQPVVETDARIGERICRQAVTLLGVDGGTLLGRNGTIAYIGPDGDLRKRIDPAVWVRTPPRVDKAVVARALREVRHGDRLIIAIATTNDRALAEALRPLLPTKPLVLILLRHPRDGARIAAPAATIVAYGASEAAQRAAADVLFSSKPCAPGRLPVTVAGIGIRGDGRVCSDGLEKASCVEVSARER